MDYSAPLSSRPSSNLLGYLPQNIEIFGIGEGGPPLRNRAPPHATHLHTTAVSSAHSDVLSTLAPGLSTSTGGPAVPTSSSASVGREFFYNKHSKIIYRDVDMMMEGMGQMDEVAVVNTVQEMRSAISRGGVLATRKDRKGKAQEDAVDMEG
ncbi:hypothetical protein K438DRAFT_1996723 [Mycena galopus ATCC 62051]|nr:hypothetical protein K438DRAFT_1996723 [Mycena galopus ATCC 62051]